jgi:hypothetical protein
MRPRRETRLLREARPLLSDDESVVTVSGRMVEVALAITTPVDAVMLAVAVMVALVALRPAVEVTAGRVEFEVVRSVETGADDDVSVEVGATVVDWLVEVGVSEVVGATYVEVGVSCVVDEVEGATYWDVDEDDDVVASPPLLLLPKSQVIWKVPTDSSANSLKSAGDMSRLP